MNDYKKKILLYHESSILSDIDDPVDIVTHLVSKAVLDGAEQDSISRSSNQTAELIQVLLRKNSGRWLEEFIYACEKDFSWISKSISNKIESEDEKRLRYYLAGRGGVPPLPQHNVTRRDYVYKLRDNIKKLKRNTFLVVHGMSGIGKTCLVVDALQDVGLLEEFFGGYVYWLSVDDLRNEEHVEFQCQQLQKKLCDMAGISLKPNQDPLVKLKCHFSINPNSEALLVLDKVRSPKVVDAFQIGCKVLLTTQDLDVVRNYDKIEFPVTEGFTESESLDLLKRFVGGNEQGFLRNEPALKIHDAWKGHPMIIGLIGGELSDFKEDSQRNLTRWEQYYKDNDLTERRRRSLINKQMKYVIGLTSEKLRHPFKERFRKLAVFVEGTNITLDVLQILWDVNQLEAETTIEHFYKRSLVFRKYNENLGKYVYGIHDILVEHLKEKLSDLEKQRMHEDLVSKYFRTCDKDFANLPNDNYIYYYLFQHIECAKKWEEHRDQFFSLLFIEAKLKATGPGDLLLDLSKYHSGLTANKEENFLKIKNISELVNDFGWDIHQSDVDVVQCALLQPRHSYLYLEAAKLANEREGKVYFCSPLVGERRKDLDMSLKGVTCVSIVASERVRHADGRVLVYPDNSVKENLIVEYDMKYRQKRRSFKESSNVVLMKMSPEHDRFLSALKDGSVHVWGLNTDAANTPPPSMRQKSYLSSFPETKTIPVFSYSHKVGRAITCAGFSSNGKYIISASEDATVCVWDLKDNSRIFQHDVKPNPYAIACTFIYHDKFIALCCENFMMFVHNLENNYKCHILQKKQYGSVINLLGLTDCKKIIVVQEKAVHLYSWDEETIVHDEGARVQDQPKLLLNLLGGTNSIICAAHHQHRLVLGTNHGCQLFSNVLCEQPDSIEIGCGVVKAVDILDERIVFADQYGVKMCRHIPGKTYVVEKPPLSVHLGWTTKSLSIFTSASSSSDIQVLHDGELIAEKYLPNVHTVHVTPNEDKVLIGTKCGEIFIFNTTLKSLEALDSKLHGPIDYLCASVLGGRPMYLATEREGTCALQVIFEKQDVMHTNLKAFMVKAFVSSKRNYLIIVLCDSSIMGWDLSQRVDPFTVLPAQPCAQVTDASLSHDENTLIVTDEKGCFHVIRLEWPNAMSNEQIRSSAETSEGRRALSLPNITNQPHATLSADEIDGMTMSRCQDSQLSGTLLSTCKLQNSSWCCTVSLCNRFVAVGHGDCHVSVYDLKKKEYVCSFLVLSSRKVKVSKVYFKNSLSYNHKIFDLVLIVVTDCLSLWDLSSYIVDNRRVNANLNPTCLACVSAGGNPFLEVSINSTCTKFAAVDEKCMYFLWEFWKAEDRSDARDSINSNGSVEIR